MRSSSSSIAPVGGHNVSEGMIGGRQSDGSRPHIVFIHLDLGIGGAERLVLDLATASLPRQLTDSDEQAGGNDVKEGGSSGRTPLHDEIGSTKASRSQLNAKVSIFTSHCSQSHCFTEVKKPQGTLSSSVHVHGSFIPPAIFGVGTAFCSTLRMLYISYHAIRTFPTADLFVLDVLPTPIPFLINWWNASSVLFYCHFPDKLLTRDTVNGIVTTRVVTQAPTTTTTGGDVGSNQNQGGLLHVIRAIHLWVRNLYRFILDQMEEGAMRYADLIAVNSEFTRGEVTRVFPSLGRTTQRQQQHHHPHDDEEQEAENAADEYIQVLYPAIDSSKFEKLLRINNKDDEESTPTNRDDGDEDLEKIGPIVSLNRFERKKNIELLLQAYKLLLNKLQNDRAGTQKSLVPTPPPPPPLVIAGGYDPRNIENVEYLAELRRLAVRHGISHFTTFRPSISDAERTRLLRTALCVAYTPHREHFGIVPLESMASGTPVVAVESGGPMETIVHGQTGFLCCTVTENDPAGGVEEEFANALHRLVMDPKLAEEMGKKGRAHVRTNFGWNQFQCNWNRLCRETMKRGKERKQRWSDRGGQVDYPIVPSWIQYLLEAGLALLVAWVLTFLLRFVGVLEEDKYIWGEVKRRVLYRTDEL